MSTLYAEVIGDPVEHSKSPIIHSFWLRQLGIEGEYRRCGVSSEELATFLAKRRIDPDWRGCNVTMPHKLAILQHLDQVDAIAGAIGAANTVCGFGDGRLSGTNTDAEGFADPLSDMSLVGRHAVVIGAGGAARAVVHALLGRSIGALTIVNRSEARARQIAASIGADVSVVIGKLADALPAADILVNASSLGMIGQLPLTLDLSPLPRAAVIYDLVYSPLETALLVDARARGMRTIDGLAMLIGQAAAAFEMFFGEPAPRAHDMELRALLTS